MKHLNKEQLLTMAKAGKNKEVIALLEQHPEDRPEAIMILVKEALNELSGPDARRQMLDKCVEVSDVLNAQVKAYDVIGRSPMIDDSRHYNGEKPEIDKAMRKEDIRIGLQLYNACASFTRMYNKAKLKMEEKDT